MGHPGGSWKGQNAKRNVDSGGAGHEVSEAVRTPGNWNRGHSCDVLVKNMIAFQ